MTQCLLVSQEARLRNDMALASGRPAETLSANSSWTLVQPATQPLLLGRDASAVPHVQARPAPSSLFHTPNVLARLCGTQT